VLSVSLSASKLPQINHAALTAWLIRHTCWSYDYGFSWRWLPKTEFKDTHGGL